MDTYNFWQDFFDTYQSLSDWIKALWLLVPPGFVLALVALVMRSRTTSRNRPDQIANGELIYSIYRDDDGLHVIGYPPRPDDQPGLILFDRPLNEPEDYRR